MDDVYCERCGVSESSLIRDGNRSLIRTNDGTMCMSCHRSNRSQNSIDKVQLIRSFTDLLQGLDLDLNDDNFRETPRRVIELLLEFTGKDIDLELELEEISNSIFPCEYDQIVTARNINTYALCPHHLLPIRYKVSIAYRTDRHAIGISKISRIADIMAKQLMLQETYTERLAKTISGYLNANDVAVVVIGEHSCMKVRGVKEPESDVITSVMLGSFRNDTMRMETLSLLGLKN